MQIHRIASQFYNRPLLLLPSAAETISAFLHARIGARGDAPAADDDAGATRQAFEPSVHADGSVEVHAPRASRFYGDYPVDAEANGQPKPYRRTADGTAIITLVGEFVNRGAYVGASSGLISYEGLKYQAAIAASDTRARNVVLDLQSPGGEAVGAFEAATAIRKLAAVKPVTAVVNGMAASAAYAVASAANRIVTTPTGISGSIGVVLMHLDFSKYLEQEGIKPTLIFAGDHKVDGNPFDVLPKDVRDEMQREVNSFYDQFVSTVAAGRSSLSEQQIRDTQARVFKGQDAVDVGLADQMGTFEDVLAESALRKSTSNARLRASKGVAMKDANGAPEADITGITQAQLDTAVSTARAEGKTEGLKEGAKAEHARITTILASDKLKGKEVSALKLAAEAPDMSADKIIEVMAGLSVTPVTAKIGDRMATMFAQPLAAADASAQPPLSASSIYAARAKALQ